MRRTVSTIHSIMVSFQENTANFDLEPSLLNAFVGLGDILIRTTEHLAAYSPNRRRASFDNFIDFLVPSRVIQQLNRDEEQLSHQLTIILFSFSSSALIRGHSITSNVKESDRPDVRMIRNDDVSDFWRDYFGGNVSSTILE